MTQHLVLLPWLLMAFMAPGCLSFTANWKIVLLTQKATESVLGLVRRVSSSYSFAI